MAVSRAATPVLGGCRALAPQGKGERDSGLRAAPVVRVVSFGEHRGWGQQGRRVQGALRNPTWSQGARAQVQGGPGSPVASGRATFALHMQPARPWGAARPGLRQVAGRLSAGEVGGEVRIEEEVDVEVEHEDEDDLWDDEDSAIERQQPSQRPSARMGLTELDLNTWRQKPVEEKYRILVERQAPQQRLEELGVQQWSVWSSPGPCAYSWEWRVDEHVYIAKGSLKVTPFGCEESAEFSAGDLVRFPKWMLAELEFRGQYEHRYRFRAYGDDH